VRKALASPLAIAPLIASALIATTVGFSHAGRCQSVNGFTGGVHCGLDSDSGPSNRYQACTEAAMAALPLKCPGGSITVIYDLDKPFPPDPTRTSHAVIRASPKSPCAGMPDKEVPMTGFVVGCWFPPDDKGCRIVKILNGGSMCLHIQHQALGAPCSADCADLSTEQIAISNAGAAEHFVCPPSDPAVSCRARRSPKPNGEKFRLWIGGFCATNSCDNPGVAPVVGSDTCVAQWGASYFGYAVGKSRDPAIGPGWYDWQSGAFKVDYRNGRATCGHLGECLGTGSSAPWDLSVIAVPRASTPPPCLAPGGTNNCNAQACIP
jgi:hypothetical protein